MDVQHTAAYNAALRQRLKAANLRQTACLEDLDLRTPRGLDRTLVATLASSQWIRTSRSVLLPGPTGMGKTFIACALGHQAARDGFPVLYRRLPRLLDDLAIARVAGRPIGPSPNWRAQGCWSSTNVEFTLMGSCWHASARSASLTPTEST